MRHYRNTTNLISLGRKTAFALGLVVLVTSPAFTAETKTETQRIIWNQNLNVLPAGAHFGEQVCVTPAGDFARLAAPDAAVWGTYGNDDGTTWFRQSQPTELTTPQPYTCEPDGVGGSLVYAVENASGTYRVVQVPEFEILVDSIDGGPVGSLAKFGNTLVVGQPEWGVGGRVLIYEYNQVFGFVLAKTFTGAVFSGLGSSIALRSDSLLFLGQPSPTGANNGIVQIWVRAAFADWVSAGTLFPPAPTPQDTMMFGASISVEGLWLAVGAPGWDQPLLGGGVVSNVGNVFLYKNEGFGFAFKRAANPGGLHGGAAYGTSVDLGPGGAPLVAGTPHYDYDGGGGPILLPEGSAWVWDRAGDAWTNSYQLQDSGSALHDEFGSTLAVSRRGVLVGVPNWDANGVSDQGAVLYYKLSLFEDGFESGSTSAWTSSTP